MPSRSSTPVKRAQPAVSRSRPDWASGSGPKIAGPTSGKAGSLRGPAVPFERGESDSSEASLTEAVARAGAPGGWRLAAAAAGLAILAALAGLLGGRLGQRDVAQQAPAPAGPPQPQQSPQQALPSAALSRIFEKLRPSVVQVVPSGGGGSQASGLIVGEDGAILTTQEAVQQGEVAVVLSDGRQVPARVVGTDPERNLAALRLTVPVPGLVAAELGNSDSVKVGDPVVAIGAPFGLDQTLTSGVVSALKRNYPGKGPIPPLKEVIQSDAPVNRGAFGGPLVNESGQVIAINMAIESPVDAFVGVGFAVPINQAKGDLLERIQEL